MDMGFLDIRLFSISHSKINSLYPIDVPPLALVIGHTLHHILDKNKNFIFLSSQYFMVFLGLGGLLFPLFS